MEIQDVWQDGTADVFEVVALQPSSWIERHEVVVGGTAPVPLDLSEMGLPNLPAVVVAVEPCPVIEPGSGRVVLTTVNHLNPYIWELTVEDGQGVTETLQPTGWHRFYSTSQEDWVPTNELAIGERLQSRHGEVTVVGLAHRPGTERVYNLTVEADHVYYVGDSQVLAHNNCPENNFVDSKDVTVERQRRGIIYEVDGSNTPSGDPYIGRSKNTKRREYDRRDGRNRKGAREVDSYPRNDTQTGMIKEQKAMDDRGGVENLDNKRREIKE